MSRQQDIVQELRNVIDLFQSKKLERIRFEEVVTTYMHDYFGLIAKRIDATKVKINAAAMLKLGKKRLHILSQCLEKNNIAKLNDLDSGVFILLDENQRVS
jgi:hypothetical protein